MARSLVVARHAGARAPGVAMACLVLILAFPRVWLRSGPDRWGWLAVSALAGLMLFRAIRLGRVVLAGEVLKIWTVWKVKRFSIQEIEEATTEQRRIGLGGNTRDVLVLLIKGSPVRLRDVNVKAGSDLLASLCKEINRLAAAARHGVQNL